MPTWTFEPPDPEPPDPLPELPPLSLPPHALSAIDMMPAVRAAANLVLRRKTPPLDLLDAPLCQGRMLEP
jgi:hypothetical protein